MVTAASSTSPTRNASTASVGNDLTTQSVRQGSNGSQVSTVQRALGKLGHELEVDGKFGPKTDAAVRAFQREQGLQVDGIVGRQTLGALRDRLGAGPVSGPAQPAGSREANLQTAKDTARRMGLTITSTTGGTHTPGSYHYQGRAIDVAGSPTQMANYYREMARLSPTELFYDPIGGIKNGRNIGAIGGHGDHVHVAF